MWEKAGGKTRFAEMKVKREESKSRAKVKREFATEAEAKRDKEKAVAARVCPGDTACHCCVETRLFIETELHRRVRASLPCDAAACANMCCRVYVF
jgi:hypothetical protein